MVDVPESLKSRVLGILLVMEYNSRFWAYLAFSECERVVKFYVRRR